MRSFTLLHFQAEEEIGRGSIKFYNRNRYDYSLIWILIWYLLTVKKFRKHSQQQQKSGVIEPHFLATKDVLIFNIEIAVIFWSLLLNSLLIAEYIFPNNDIYKFKIHISRA